MAKPLIFILRLVAGVGFSWSLRKSLELDKTHLSRLLFASRLTHKMSRIALRTRLWSCYFLGIRNCFCCLCSNDSCLLLEIMARTTCLWSCHCFSRGKLQLVFWSEECVLTPQKGKGMFLFSRKFSWLDGPNLERNCKLIILNKNPAPLFVEVDKRNTTHRNQIHPLFQDITRSLPLWIQSPGAPTNSCCLGLKQMTLKGWNGHPTSHLRQEHRTTCWKIAHPKIRRLIEKGSWHPFAGKLFDFHKAC